MFQTAYAYSIKFKFICIRMLFTIHINSFTETAYFNATAKKTLSSARDECVKILI